MKRMWMTVLVGSLAMGAGQLGAQQPAATGARQAAQDEIVRRQEAQLAGVSLINQGEELYYQGQYENAIPKLEAGLKILPRAQVTEIDYNRGSRFLSDAYYQLGDAAYRAGNAVQAREWADKSLKADPTNRSANSLVQKANKVDRAAMKAQEEPRLDKTPEFEAQQADIKKLFREGQLLFNSGQFDEAEVRFKQIVAIDRYNDDALALLQRVNQARQDSSLIGGRAVRTQRMWEVSDAWVPAIRKESATVEKQVAAGPISTSSVQTAETLRKLNEIIVPEINFRDAVIADVVNFLSTESRRLDPQKNGVNILLGAGVGGGEAAPVAPAPAPVPAPEGTAPATPVTPATPETGGRRITLSLRTVPLVDALKYVTSLVGLKYRVEANAVLILPADAVEGGLLTRNYPVNPGAIRTVLAAPAAAAPATTSGTETYRAFGSGASTMGTADVKGLFTDAGVPFPTGSSIVYNERTSMIIVRNTAENLEIFERVLAAFNVVPSQVEIEAKFIDVQQKHLDELGFNWKIGAFQFGGYNQDAGRRQFQIDDGTTSNLRDSNLANINQNSIDALLNAAGAGPVANTLGSISGILTDPTVQLVIKALSQKGDTDLLSAPKVTTISGQQAQIKVVQEFIYPSRYKEPQVSASNNGNSVAYAGSIPEEFKTREVGVLLNVTPTVGADGNTINLTLVPEVSEFLGNLDYSSLSQVNNQSITNRIVQPLFGSRNLTTSIIIWDGQTVVLGGLLREDLKTINDKVPFLGDIPWVGRLFQSKVTSRTKRNLLIFVSARLVDPAGNPIHRANRKVGM